MGTVTLITRQDKATDKNELHVDEFEILPGGKINFTAWYKPGEENIGPYTFTFDIYGNGSYMETVEVEASDKPIRIHPENFSFKFTVPGRFYPKVTVEDSGTDDAADDDTTINVVEKYLSITGSSRRWEFEKISESLEDDGKIHGYIKVQNIANNTYSPGYTIDWNLTGNDNMSWGTNWSFNKNQGTLGPGESEIINYSFIPPTEPRDYTGVKVTINNINDSEESKRAYFSIYYGLVYLFPNRGGDPLLFINKGEIKTFDNVIWVHSARWEQLDWNISNVSAEKFNLSDIDYSFIPDNGTILPGDPLTPISLYLDASNEDFKGTENKLIIKIQRKGDPYDNDTITITIRVVDIDGSGGGSSPSEWVTPDGQEYNWWFFPNRARDNKLDKASFYRNGHGGWTKDSLILTLDSPISCNGFRINAKSGDHLDQLEVKLFSDDTEKFSKTFNDGEWQDHVWTEHDFGSIESVDRAEIRFHLEDGYTYGTTLFPPDGPHWGVVWEFDFKEDI